MGVSILSIIIVFVIIALWVVMNGYKIPTQESNESDEDYQKRIKDYNCTYEGNRNLLLVGLVIAIGAYLYKNNANAALHEGVWGGYIESMEDDEHKYYDHAKKEKKEKMEEKEESENEN